MQDWTGQRMKRQFRRGWYETEHGRLGYDTGQDRLG